MRPPDPGPGDHTGSATARRHAERSRAAVRELLADDPILNQCGITFDRVRTGCADIAFDDGYHLRLRWADPHGSTTAVVQRLSVSVHAPDVSKPSSATTLTVLLERVIAVLRAKPPAPLTRIALRAGSGHQATTEDPVTFEESATFDVLSHISGREHSSPR